MSERGPADPGRRRLLLSSAVLLAAGAAMAPGRALAEESGDGPKRRRRQPPEELEVFVRPREAWGAAPPVQPYVPHTPAALVVHHTGVAWSGQVPIEQHLRNIQKFHTGPEREWEDIAYHFLVDPLGVVWAGRPPEVRGNPSVYYDALGLLTVCFIGNYDLHEPNEAQLAAAGRVAAGLIRRFKLPSDVISAHRDRAPTTCPGGHVHRLVQNGSFARRVREMLA